MSDSVGLDTVALNGASTALTTKGGNGTTTCGCIQAFLWLDNQVLYSDVCACVYSSFSILRARSRNIDGFDIGALRNFNMRYSN